ncbi:recombinase family protein [Brevibacterium linens]|uniref:recombinase family protein n=1 Tax=Brevibacterium linens TaxID=1703 RepID=UPI003F89ECEC
MSSSRTSSRRLGYGRVPTVGQNLEQQLDSLKQAGCSRVFSYTGSGARSDRPGIKALRDHVRPCDTVLVTSLDRLGRSMSGILGLIHEFAEEDVSVETLDGLSTDPRKPGGKILLAVTAAMAEVERDLILERTNAGLKSARARGRTGGRKPRLAPSQDQALLSIVDAGQQSLTAIADDFNISWSTLYRVLERHRDKSGAGPTVSRPGPD